VFVIPLSGAVAPEKDYHTSANTASANGLKFCRGKYTRTRLILTINVGEMEKARLEIMKRPCFLLLQP
jgi:hypothetical protein